MPRAKSNLLIAAEWLWSKRNKDLWWGPEVLTTANKDISAPKMTAVEALSVFKVLEERALIFRAEDGRPVYHLHEAKEKEWTDFLSELSGRKSKGRGNATPLSEANAPDISEPLRFLLHHISKNWHHLQAAPLAFGAIAVLAFLAGWFVVWQIVVVSKDATIEQWRTSKEIADKDNEKLSQQLAELKIYRGQDALPLKRKALILAQQIRDFTKDWKDTDSPDVQNATVWKYLNRFGLRAQIIRDDLDQSGQQADTFDNVMYNFGYNYKDVRTIADEIEKLAKNLPD